MTGHACLAVGDYTAVVANGPFRRAKLDLKLQEAGEIVGDQFDVGTIRREDYEFHMGKDEQSDVLQVISIVGVHLLTLGLSATTSLRRRLPADIRPRRRL